MYIDLTFGGGGHSKEILKKIDKGRLFSFDRDKEAEKNSEDILKEKINKEKFIFVRSNFIHVKNFLKYYGVEKVDGLLADLGVSSHQFDTRERGFSFRLGGELDMRMNVKSETTAADILNNYEEENLYNIFKKYGEIKNPYHIVKKIIEYRTSNKIKNVEQFNEILKPHFPKHREYKFLAKVYQALRIETNKELAELELMLESTNDIIKKGGRLTVLTYHSLEDRLVKNFIKTGNVSGKQEKDLYGNLKKSFNQINNKVIVPNEEEIQLNNRARSAKLRIAEKV